MSGYISLPWKITKRYIDKTAMYRVVTIALMALAVTSITLGFLGIMPYTGGEQLSSLVVAVLTALLLNVILARLWKISANHESALITALILFFIVIPPFLSDITDQFIMMFVVMIAILSKFIFVWHKQHIVNPAAFGVLALGIIYTVFPLSGYFESGWWIGTPVLFLPLLLAGSLVVMKVRRWEPVLVFLAVGFLVFVFESWRFGSNLSEVLPGYFLSGPSLFLAFFMLTEPFTMPPTKKLQMSYGALVGVVSQTTFFSPWIKMTPELALVIGNLLFYPTTLKRKLILELDNFRKIAENTYEFIFKKPTGLAFKAGQYLEWMLPHKEADSRGIRRYFTIASSPTESTLRIALKMTENGSTYKKQLINMNSGDKIIASQLSGDFLLPEDTKIKLGFIAGGIGVTPFRSQFKYMLDTGNLYDTVLFYTNNTKADIAYTDFFAEVEKHESLRVVHVLSKEELEKPYEHGFITEEMLKRQSADFLERRWYLSGPPPMVDAYFNLLVQLGVSRGNIVKDYFPGLA